MSHDTFSRDEDRAVLAVSMKNISHSNISILKRYLSEIYKTQMYKVYILNASAVEEQYQLESHLKTLKRVCYATVV